MPDPPGPKHDHYATARITLQAEAAIDFFSNPEMQATARVAGVIAARRAGEFVPYAAAAEVDSVEIHYEADDQTLTIEVRVDAVSRKHLETRALLAASVCAVTWVDMAPDGMAVEIGANELIETGGGLYDKPYDFDPPLEVAVLVISDAVHSGRKQDDAGEAVRTSLTELAPMGVEVVANETIPDDVEIIRTRVQSLCASGLEVILCVGGTGLTPTDRTIEAIEPLFDRAIPGLMEAVRVHGQERTPRAFVSRGIAGLIGETLVVTLPGSSSGAREAMQALGPSFLHVPYVQRRS